MKEKSTALILLLALSMISMISVVSMKRAVAVGVVGPTTTNPGIIDWVPGSPDGYTNYMTLFENPEYLNLYTETPLLTRTTVIVQGTDAYGQNIEAKVQVGPITANQEGTFIFNDTHTTPPRPVAFTTITKIFQQNGTHNDRFLIQTQPEPWEEYLGQWHLSTHWLPGEYLWEYSDARKYLVAHGVGQTCTTQDVPVEPSNPDPVRIYINWHESTDHDLIPDAWTAPNTGEWGALSSTPPSGSYWIWIEGLDQKGNKYEVNTTIPAGVHYVDVVHCPTWASICKVEGNGPDSYYLFTEPQPKIQLFRYTLLIDHMTITPDSYDILANPTKWNVSQAPHQTVWLAPGVTNINVTLRDKDGNLISASSDIVVNFATSGGRVQPSSDVYIRAGHFFLERTVNLTADTNARTINVTADANVLSCGFCPHMNLFAWTEMTFDGINSVGTDWTDIHTLMWGYHTWIASRMQPGDIVTPVYIGPLGWQTPWSGPVPPKPYVPTSMGGPAALGTKLDGPIYEVSIPLYVGCNLISSPVVPLFGKQNWQGTIGIDMSLLFGNTSATTCIEAVWWYCDGWQSYIPGVDGCGKLFKDGVGYWIKAEKRCTLEISGVSMENAPFMPPEYPLSHGWNLVGFTSIHSMSINDYLESTNSGNAYMTVPGATTVNAIGPVWTYYAYNGYWFRNPSWGLYPGYGFWVYNKFPDDYVSIAP